MFAGGTDMLVVLRTGRREASALVDVKGIPELNELSYNDQSGLTLGAAVPCYKIYEDKLIPNVYQALADSASLIGGIQIQSRASIGGNLCNAAPSADAVPSLIVHAAVAIIGGPNGTRELPVEEFCTGPGQNSLKNGECLISLKLPNPAKNSGSMYLRFIPRNEMDIAVAGSGVSVVLSDDKSSIVSARVSLASVAPTPLFVKEAGEFLAGKNISDDVIAEAGQIAKKAAKPITDMRGTIEQRKHLCDVLTRRALTGAIARAKEAN
jgi:carbon-monoxide dehydrogenase medium subunit